MRTNSRSQAESQQALAERDSLLRLMARVGPLEYLAACLRSQASAELLATQEFTPRQQAVMASVLAQDKARVEAALAALKAPYSRLFLMFG